MRRDRPRRLRREGEIRAAERRRIGQDLHDGVGQILSGVAFMTRALERKLAARLGPTDNGTADAAQIAEIVEEGMARTRSMTRLLDPVGLEAAGLTSALGKMASDFERVFAGLGVRCTFEHDARVLIDDYIDDDAVAAHLYRIAQEAATNAIRHGGARHVEIGLKLQGEGAVLTVQDDGTGLLPGGGGAPAEAVDDVDDVDDAARQAESTEGPDDGAEGMGLRIMDDRARSIGGKLTIRRRPEGGILLTCAFPRREKQQKESARQ